MSHPSQPHIVVDEAAGRFEVQPTAEERAHVAARTIRHALKLALIAAAAWYVAWFAFAINVSAWAGLAVFGIAYVLGFAFARLRLQQALAYEMRRRSDLLELRARLQKQHDSNQLKGE